MNLDLSIWWTRCEVRSDVEHTMTVEIPALNHQVMPMGALEIPRFIPHTKPTPPDRSDTTEQDFRRSRINPTPPDHSDRLHPPNNPWVVGSIPIGPTKSREKGSVSASGLGEVFENLGIGSCACVASSLDLFKS